MRRSVAFVAAATMMLALLPTPGGATPTADPGVVPGAYIVVLESGDPGAVAAEHSRAHNASVAHVYRHALRGYAARMSERAAARIAADPRVAYVDVDRVVTTAHHQCGHDKPTPYAGDCDAPSPEPGTGTIAGTVTTSSGDLLSGATVTVGGTTLSATSGDDGAYSIIDVPVGEHTVTATAEGFDPQGKTVSVEADQTTTVGFALTATSTGTLQPVPWGVARVVALLRGGNTGAGIHVYVIDTGIDPDHRDLTVSEGYAVERCRGGGCAADWDDDHGHGTHVAGTIGALDNDVDVVGVAPDVTLHAVKVLAKNGSGTRSGVIADIDGVAGHNTGVARVANMSLGGSGSKTGTCATSGFTGSDAYHEAICTATHVGVVFAVAAGNNGADAAGAVPAAYADTVITVSATNADPDWPSWSNWGDDEVAGIPTASAPVGIAAPGVSIPSTRAGGGTTTMSGTSMAAPHAAGAAALFLNTEPEQTAGYGALANARADLLGRAESTQTQTWTNTSGKSHLERFLQVTGL
ncbi:MAG: S8 family serine peptidase [Egibacteraceae bacterium]